MSRRTQRWNRGMSNNNGSLSGRSQINNNSNKNIMRELNGHKFMPPEMPPVLIGQPWNNMTLILRITGAAQDHKIVLENIRVALRSQTGFNNVPDQSASSTSCHFDVRIKALSVWGTDGNSISVLPMDLISNNCELTRIDSNAQKNMYARVGYKLPLAQSSITMATARTKDKVVLILSGASSYEVHMNVLWKGADTAFPKKVFEYPPSSLHIRRKQLETELAELKLLDDLQSTSEYDRLSAASITDQ